MGIRKLYFESYYQRNKASIREKAKAHYEENKEELRVKAREYHHNHKDQKKAYGILWRSRLRDKVFSHYGGGKRACVRCGFMDVRALSIDHINGVGIYQRRAKYRAGTELYKYLLDNDYPDGYQTLCMNCQFIKRHTNQEHIGGKYEKL